MASSSETAAFNIGIAGGAWLGGHVVEDMGLMNTPWIGGVIVLSALLLTRLSASLDNRQTATAEDVKGLPNGRPKLRLLFVC